MAARPAAPVQILPPTAVLVPAAVVQEKLGPVELRLMLHDDVHAQIEWLAHEDCWRTVLTALIVQFRTDSSWFPGRMAVEMSLEAQRAGRFIFQEQGSYREIDLVLIFMGHWNPVTSCHLATDAVTKNCHGLG